MPDTATRLESLRRQRDRYANVIANVAKVRDRLAEMPHQPPEIAFCPRCIADELTKALAKPTEEPDRD